MAGPKDEKNPPQEPEGAGDAQPPAPSPGAAPPIDEMVEAAIGRLAASGKIFGGEEGGRQPESSPPPSSEGHGGAGGFDLEGAITRVLERRDQERKSSEQQQSLQEKVDKLEKSASERVKKWWEPWSPWS